MLCVTVYSSAVAGFETFHLHRKRLLVELSDLRLTGIHDSGHTRWKHIVDRLAVGILFDIDHRDVEFALGRDIAAGIQIEVVCTPFAAHKFESGKTQMGGLFESGHEHAGKADGGEVLD